MDPIINRRRYHLLAGGTVLFTLIFTVSSIAYMRMFLYPSFNALEWIKHVDGWECPSTYDGKCMKVFGNRRRQWSAANEYCQDQPQQDARLITIGNRYEEAVVEHAVNNYTHAGCALFWLGAFWNETGHFQWIDGQPVTYIPRGSDLNNANASSRIAIHSSTLRWVVAEESHFNCFVCLWDVAGNLGLAEESPHNHLS